MAIGMGTLVGSSVLAARSSFKKSAARMNDVGARQQCCLDEITYTRTEIAGNAVSAGRPTVKSLKYGP
jgi:hypothetical protein